jgi:hypothetical protein
MNYILIILIALGMLWLHPLERAPSCQTLIGFYVHGDKLVNVYGPCGRDDCSNDPKVCG